MINVQNGKDKDSLIRFYQGLTKAELAAIETVSMDMSPAYIHATLEQIPDAKKKICFDKFHIIQDLNKAVDGVRKTEMTNIATSHRKSLHLSKYIWMRNEKNLTETHQQIKSQLNKVAIKTARAWAILQYAKSLWSYCYAKAAEKAWMKWYSWATKSRLVPMKAAAKSIKEKLWGIINAITKNRTNAKLKMIKVRAKGFRSESRYKNAIMFYLGGLTLKH